MYLLYPDVIDPYKLLPMAYVLMMFFRIALIQSALTKYCRPGG